MKTKKLFTFFVVLVMAMLLTSTAFAADPTSNPGGGNMTCAELGYDYSSERVDYYNDGGFDAAFPAGISVEVTDGTYVEWTSTFPIGAVIVKGGDDANVYEYVPPAYGDSGLASPINASTNPAGLSNLTFCWNEALQVSKTAETAYDRNWTWDIEKVGDQTSLTLSTGQGFLVNYDVTVSAISADGNWEVFGDITIYNPNLTAAATIEDVTDSISGFGAVSVDCGVIFPYVLAAGDTLTCSYATALPDGDDRTNTATAETSGKVAGGSGSAGVEFGAPSNIYDECIVVNDDQYGLLGTVCANEAPYTYTFEYSMTLSYDVCGEYEFVNVADFVTNDTFAIGSDSWKVDVDVPCPGCTLTQGYWKTHSWYGPAPYDATWALVGEETLFYLSDKSWFQVFWTAPAGNAYYNLAHQYMAAKLNILNGAGTTPEVELAMTEAEAFFSIHTPGDKLNKTVRAIALALASTLDQYNNGYIGPGHCDE